MLGKLLSGLGFDGFFPDHFQSLKKSFAPLNSISAGIDEKIMKFLLEGSHSELLIEIRNNAAITGDLILKPGRLFTGVWSYNYDKSIFAAAKQSAKSRNSFYEAVTTENTPLVVLSRLGRLLQAIDKDVSLDDTGVKLSANWFAYLLYDVLFSTEAEYSYNGKPLKRPGWSLEILQKIALEEDLQKDLVFLMIFERKNTYSYTISLAHMLSWQGSYEWLLANHDIVNNSWTKLSAAGKKYLVEVFAGHDKLRAAYTSLLVQLTVDASKTVRETAIQYVRRLPQEQRIRELTRLLETGSSNEKIISVTLLSRENSPEAFQALEKALSSAPGKALEEELKMALTRAGMGDAQPQTLVIPVLVPWPEAKPLSNSVLELLLQNWKKLRVSMEASAEEEIARNKLPETTHKYHYAEKSWKDFQKITESRVEHLFNILNDFSLKLEKLHHQERQIFEYSADLASHPEFTLDYLIRYVAMTNQVSTFWNHHLVNLWFEYQQSPDYELRHLAACMLRNKLPVRPIADNLLLNGWRRFDFQEILPANAIWPFCAEHPEFIEEALGMLPSATGSSYYSYDVGRAFKILESFPEIPAKFIARILEIAFGDAKTHRLEAQQLAMRFPDIRELIVTQLPASKQEKRLIAIHWIARIQLREAVPDLLKQLKKEKSEIVRGALLSALEKLGEDIQPFLTPEILLAEAQKGLSAKLAAGIEWFPFEQIPALQWASDKSFVDPQIIRWWVVFCFKLKEPGGNTLVERYLSLLTDDSRSILGKFILHQFIVQDTRNPSNEEANAYAQANAQQRFVNYQHWAQHYPEYASKTLEQCFEELRREKLNIYLGSAIAAKGILALISGAPGFEVVNILRNFMRDHYTRGAQVMALLEAAAISNDPAIIQLLLSISRRYRTHSVQERARQLVENIAERNQWTHDQLGDRTIPTAGLDEKGELLLEYGERQFIASLDTGIKPILRNTDGKEIKSLPEPRKNDAPEVIKEAKSLWSQCKKEVKQVVELQSARLYEAMCASRLWPVSEWQEYIAAHPIVGRLVQQLIWLYKDAEGNILTSFRPTEDGSLIDLNDDEVELTEGVIQLAHTSLLGEQATADWLRHLKDYKVKPLFVQLNRANCIFDEAKLKASEIKDREGWLSDAFTLRNQLTKSGYQRSNAEDGGFFTYYFKDFTSLGICVCIGFTGNSLPEENVAAAITELYFEKISGNRWNAKRIAIGDVPPVLLGEAYADYLAAASVGVFDESWKKKTPW